MVILLAIQSVEMLSRRLSFNGNKIIEPFFLVRSRDLLQLAYDVLDGLRYMNEHGLVHRCLAPENLLVDAEVSGVYMTVYITLHKCYTK